MSTVRMLRPASLFVVLAAAVLAAGCGGSDSKGSSGAKDSTSGSKTTASGGGGTASATCQDVDADFATGTDPAKLAVKDRAGMFESAPSDILKPDSNCVVHLVTNKGAFDIHVDAKAAPIAASNFVFLARSGYFDGIVFHRILKGFMVQTGDPKGDGTGDPGYSLKDDKVVGSYTRGTVAMANAGPNTGGSQFFIVQGDGVDQQLPKDYVIFGIVDAAGMKVVDTIAGVPVTTGSSGEPSSPTKPVKIVSAKLVG